MKPVIVGTAGHIDHGKSKLVEALTGTDPDRWEEEKRRGITIDLGFAHLDLGEARLGFVDVPGHERFVRNMLAGAGGIDLVLLVIAADESIKPQTREHFDICRLLGIERGLVALTKADLVEADVLELVRLEAEEFLKASFLEGAPILPVSSKTGAGLEQLREELRRAALSVPEKDSARPFRLPIDRAFVMKGFGTVVTGTLVAGSVAVEQEVEVYPTGRRVRVRGVQVHGEAVARAEAGQRTALNLAGVEAGTLERGIVLSEPGRFAASDRVDAELHLLPSARPLKEGARAHFHQGTVETVAEVRLLGTDKLEPGAEAFAQLRLRTPALLLPGDRFILRQFSPVITIGGGRVLDASPAKHKRSDPTVVDFLRTLAGDDRAAMVEALVKREPRGALTAAQLEARTGWPAAELRDTIEALTAAGRLREAGSPDVGGAGEPQALADPARWAELRRGALETLDAFHRKEPLLEGISKQELRARVFGRAAEAMFDAVVAELAAGGELTVAGDLVKRAGRRVTLSHEEGEAKRAIELAFAQAGLTVPAVKEVLGEAGVEPRRAQKIVLLLLREGALVKLSEDLLFHRTALEELRRRLRDYKQKQGERLSVAAFKDLAGVTRKYAIPLLEYLDRQKATRRAGDERVILL